MHPDKCKLPGAEQAFRLVKHAAERLLAALERLQLGRTRMPGEGTPGGQIPSQDSSGSKAHAGPGVGGEGGWEGVDLAADEEEDDGYQWWQPWECPAHRMAGTMPSTEPTQEDEDQALWHISLQV